MRRRCHAAGWAHGRGAKRPFRETCRWASPSLFFRLHGLLAPLCAYPTRFLSRCGGCATPHCLPLREKHLAPAAQLLFRLRGSLCGCDPRLRASCHAAGWAHGRVAKRPFREKCRWASPSLFFPLHVLLAPLCAYPPRFCVVAALVAARLAGGLGEEERGGRGQAPPLRVSVGRAGPMGTRCSTRRGSRPKPQKKIAKMVLTGYFEIGYNIICIVQACTV